MPGGVVRTTVYLDEDLYLAAKKKAVEEKTTLTAIIKQGVHEQIKKERHRAKRLFRLGSYNLKARKTKPTYRREEIYDFPKL